MSRVATAALGRQLMMTAMMASTLKNETDKVTTIISGDGMSGNMVCTGRYGASVKGYTPDPTAELAPKDNGKLDVGGYVGHSGTLTVIRDLSLKEPYVGSCALVSGEIAEDFAQYYMVSEQQPTAVYLGVHVRAEDGCVLSGGGVIISALPNCPDEDIDSVTDRIWLVSELAYRLADGEELEAVIDDVFQGLDLKILGSQPTAFECDCSEKRLERALISIGEKDLTELIEQDGQAELTCQFCNKVYHFSKDDLIRLRQEATADDR